jgi:hypothetical protein
MKSSKKTDRRFPERCEGRARRRYGGWKAAASALTWLLAAGLLPACGVEQGVPTQGAEEPFRLRLMREATDLEAAGAGGCIRGRLSVVRSFDAAARGVWIADTLEQGDALPAGVHAGIAGEENGLGWQIALPEVGTVLRAHPVGLPEDAAGAILLGKRAGSPADAGPCDPATESLDHGAALLRRLRDAYASPGGERPIEVSIEP